MFRAADHVGLWLPSGGDASHSPFPIRGGGAQTEARFLAGKTPQKARAAGAVGYANAAICPGDCFWLPRSRGTRMS